MNLVVQHRDARLRRGVVDALHAIGVHPEEVDTPSELRRRLGKGGIDGLLLELDALRTSTEQEWLAAIAGELPVVCLCADRRASRVIRALRLGVSSVLGLPVHLSELEQALSRWPLRSDGHRQEPLDPAARELGSEIERAAAGDSTLYVAGEAATGRRRVAASVHRRSRRREGPLEVFLCAGGSQGELFGGAPGPDGRAGAIDRTRGGTLVLHEILELSLPLQQRLLSRMVTRGDPAFPRLIATGRADLHTPQARGCLEPNLRRRLDVWTLRVPPLRERPEELIRTARNLLRRLGRSLDLPVPELSPEAEAQLRGLSLPGNHAELEGTLRRAVVLAPGRVLRALPGAAAAAGVASPKEGPVAPQSFDLRTLERDAIERSLAATGGNRTHAARALGISVRTLRDKIRRYGLAEAPASRLPEASEPSGRRILPTDPSV